MESYGARLGFLLLALPLFLIVHWLGWDERIAHAGVGFLMACAIAGQDLDEETFEPPLGLYLVLATCGVLGSVLAALLVQHLASGNVGLYDLAVIDSDLKSVRALTVMPVALASFALTMFAFYFAVRRQLHSESDT